MFNLLLIPYRQLYYLQLENYELPRFLRLVLLSFQNVDARAPVRWTPKMLSVIVLAVILASFFVAGARESFGLIAAGIAVGAAYFGFFVFVTCAVWLMGPVDWLSKKYITHTASRKLLEFPQVTVIAIAGSFGKTTMKSVLSEVIAMGKKVVVTPDSYNTPIGISRTILSGLTKETEVLILELGEHYPGDLAYLTKYFPPDITVITGINEAHLERFNTMDALTRTIFEAVEGTKKEGMVVLNADSELVMRDHATHAGSRKVEFYSAHSNTHSLYAISDSVFLKNGSGQSFTVRGIGGEAETISVGLLGGYMPGVVVASVIIAKKLGISMHTIKEGLAHVQPVPHRLRPIDGQNGTLVIDDSYNGNPDGVRYAIEVLAKFTDRRKVFVTPGLVELGLRTAGLHQDIGISLSDVADVVILIKNSVTPYIEGGLLSRGFKKESIYWFNTAKEAHANLGQIVKAGDVVMFQNDWPDNYN